MNRNVYARALCKHGLGQEGLESTGGMARVLRLKPTKLCGSWLILVPRKATFRQLCGVKVV